MVGRPDAPSMCQHSQPPVVGDGELPEERGDHRVEVRGRVSVLGGHLEQAVRAAVVGEGS